jgi:hypothetical protein
MKYAVEMASGSLMKVSSYIKIGSVIRKLRGAMHRQRKRERETGDLISVL